MLILLVSQFFHFIYCILFYIIYFIINSVCVLIPLLCNYNDKSDLVILSVSKSLSLILASSPII